MDAGAMTSATPTDSMSPVHDTPEDKGRASEEGLALCLSGGDYRAMVFHVGVLWRLNFHGVRRIHHRRRPGHRVVESTRSAAWRAPE